MKKQINPKIKAHLIRSAFYVLLLLAVCVIPFALAQRNTPKRSAATKPKDAATKAQLAAQLTRAKSVPSSLVGKRQLGPQHQPASAQAQLPYDVRPMPVTAASKRVSQTPQKTSGPAGAHMLRILPQPKAPQVVLYDQYDNAGANATLSATFTDFPTFSSDLADDFVVPGGDTWNVESIDADGVYFNGVGPATDWNVFIYTDSGGLPGTQIFSATNIPIVQVGTTFTANLAPAAVLSAGTYWIEIQANMTFGTQGEWGWTDRTVQSNNPAAWQNPGGGLGVCPTWAPKLAVCIPTASGPDQVYRINGTTGGPCTDPILNGGFETGDFTDWVTGGPPTPVVSTNEAHSGTFSAFGGDSTDGFCGFPGTEIPGDSTFYQEFTVPASGGTLSFWYWTCTTDSIAFDWQDAYITDTSGTILQTIFHQCTDNEAWVNQTVDMAPYAGLTVRVEYLVHTDNFGDLTGMYVDDVTMCAAGPPPSPTPTPSPSGTPSGCVVNGSIDTGDPTQTDRLFRSGIPQTCPASTTCAVLGDGLPRHYDEYTFTNTTGATQCVTVDTNTPCTGTNFIFTGAYLGSFDPANICTNWIGDSGSSPNPDQPFQFNLDDGQTVVIVVSEVTPDAGCTGYTVTVSGICGGGVTPTPTATPTCPPGVAPMGVPGPWTAGNPYPTTIVRYGFAQTATHFYVFGGVDNGAVVNAVNRMDLATGLWEPRAAMPTVGGEAPTCALDASAGIVYCTDGLNGSGFFSYNIATDTWATLASIPQSDTYGSASGAFNGKVFVAGGSGAITNAVWVYDIGLNTWSPGTAAPSVFLLAGYQQVGQFLYVVGGFDPTFANNATTWRLDMSSAPGTWDTGPAFTPQLADFGLAYDAGTNKLYSLGGDLPNDGNPFNSTNQVNELDVSGWPGGTWNPSPPDLPTPFRQANQAGFYGNGDIWSVGGINGATFQFLPEVWHRNNGGGVVCPSPTPTATPSATATATATPTPASPTPTATATITPPPPTPTATPTPSATRPPPTPRPRPTPYPRPTP